MKAQKKLTKHDWNFGDASEDELMVCCIWEYARESVSIRDAVKIAKTAYANQGIARPESVECEAFRFAADKAFGLLHSTGFDNSFWVGLPFPEPWQSVDKTKREKWARVHPEIPTPIKFPPFGVAGDICIVGELYGQARQAHEARQAIYLRLSQIDSGAANLKEAGELRKKLSEQERHPTPPMLRGQGGVDFFVAQINWHEFSKKDIKKCFNKWVDDYSCPIAKPSKRGHKPADWRASLERLGLLRLRSRYTFDKAKSFLKQLHPPQQSAQSQPPRKYNDKGECNREAEKALDDFREIFPFLNTETPLAWPLK